MSANERPVVRQLGTFGAWFNPVYDDSARTAFVVEAEALGYTTAWLGLGRRAMADLSLVQRALDATTTITVATAIVNMWTNDAATIASSYQRIAAKHPDRFGGPTPEAGKPPLRPFERDSGRSDHQMSANQHMSVTFQASLS